MNELISIVIPTFNHAQYLERCLKSVESQTISNYEIIVVDNHSTDNTKNIVDNFKHLPIKYLLINNEGIYAKSRNLGIKNSSGDIIGFMHSDDFYTDDKIISQVAKIFKEKNVDIVYGDAAFFLENNTVPAIPTPIDRVKPLNILQ